MELSLNIRSMLKLKGEDMKRYVQIFSKIGADPYNIPRHMFRGVTSLQNDELSDIDYGNIYSYVFYFKSTQIRLCRPTNVWRPTRILPPDG